MKSPLKGTKFASGWLSSCLAVLIVGAGAVVFAPATADAVTATFTWSGAGTPTAIGRFCGPTAPTGSVAWHPIRPAAR